MNPLIQNLYIFHYTAAVELRDKAHTCIFRIPSEYFEHTLVLSVIYIQNKHFVQCETKTLCHSFQESTKLGLKIVPLYQYHYFM